MTPFSIANRIFVLQSLPVSLLLFEITYVRAASVSPDELNVPYVPYVVVDRNKDDFDYERLQDSIVKYLENRSQRQPYHPKKDGASLYDQLKSGAGAGAGAGASSSIADNHVHYEYEQSPAISDSGNYSDTSRYPLGHGSTSYTTFSPHVHQPSSQHVADTRSISVYPFGVSDIHPAYYSNVFKPGVKIKDNSEVTANVKVTTFQPHRYLTTPLNTFSFANLSSRQKPDTTWYPSMLETATPKFVPLKSSLVSSPLVDSILSEAHTNNVDYSTSFNKSPFAGEKKCSLRSSRYVYDGGCVSKKPVVETVCADRCIKYEVLNGSEKPFYEDVPYRMERQTSPVEKNKKAVALTCKDGDVRKHKIKLYCKDGTILNNVIRIVSNCICREHSEKVHTTKRSHHSFVNSRVRMMSRPPIKVRVRV